MGLKNDNLEGDEGLKSGDDVGMSGRISNASKVEVLKPDKLVQTSYHPAWLPV